MISAFVPCTRPDEMLGVLDDLLSQATPIDKIVIVDNNPNSRLKNCAGFEKYRESCPHVTIIEAAENIGTNAVWNMGLCSECDFVLFVPDDMRFDSHFTKKALHVFKDQNVGIVSARIIPWELPLPQNAEENYECRRVAGHGRAGVFIVRGTVARKIPAIPSELFIFFGDDWIDYHCRFEQKKIWTQLRFSCARHKYGSGVSATLKKTVLKRERVYWRRFIKENNLESCFSIRK